MKIKTLAAIAISGFLAISIANAAPAPSVDDNNNNMGGGENFGAADQDPLQMADNGAGGSMSGTYNNMSGTPGNNMSGTPNSNMSGMPGSNMSGMPGSSMSGMPNGGMSGMPGGNMSDSTSPSDEGGADTATGDDY